MKTKLFFVVCKDGKNHYSNDNGQPVIGSLMALLLADLDKQYPEKKSLVRSYAKGEQVLLGNALIELTWGPDLDIVKEGF